EAEPIERDRDMMGAVIGGAEFTPDGKHLVLQVNEKFFVFDTATGKELRSFPGEGGIPIGMTISPDGKWLLGTAYGKSVETKLPDGSTQHSSPKDHPVVWWDLTTGEQRKQILLPEEGAGSVAFSPDGTWFAVASSRPGAQIRIMDAATGREVRKIEGL